MSDSPVISVVRTPKNGGTVITRTYADGFVSAVWVSYARTVSP